MNEYRRIVGSLQPAQRKRVTRGGQVIPWRVLALAIREGLIISGAALVDMVEAVEMAGRRKGVPASNTAPQILVDLAIDCRQGSASEMACKVARRFARLTVKAEAIEGVTPQAFAVLRQACGECMLAAVRALSHRAATFSARAALDAQRATEILDATGR